MLHFLASGLLKEIADRWEDGPQPVEYEPQWRPKKRRQSLERSCLPTAVTLPNAINADFGTSPPKKGPPSDESAAYLALPRVAKSKGCCPFGTAVAKSINSTLKRSRSNVLAVELVDGLGPTPDWRAVPRRDALNRILRSHAPAANAGRTRAILISERAQRARHEGHRPLADDSADRYDAASIVA